jgi:hypothetical protein
MDAVSTHAATYQRHAPEQGVLYQVLAEHLETFLQEARTEDHGLPAYVERDLRPYLECGVLTMTVGRAGSPSCSASDHLSISTFTPVFPRAQRPL